MEMINDPGGNQLACFEPLALIKGPIAAENPLRAKRPAFGDGRTHFYRDGDSERVCVTVSPASVCVNLAGLWCGQGLVYHGDYPSTGKRGGGDPLGCTN